jgi:hypothetical protein
MASRSRRQEMRDDAGYCLNPARAGSGMIAVLRIDPCAAVFLIVTLACCPCNLPLGAGHSLMRGCRAGGIGMMCRIIGLGSLSMAACAGRPLSDRLQPCLLERYPGAGLCRRCGLHRQIRSPAPGLCSAGWRGLQRSVFVERTRPAQDRRADLRGLQRLLAGEVVVLFAEGTTSDGNRVMPFKSSLFGAASAALPLCAPDGVVHIQPVAIAYTGIHGLPMGRYHRPVAAGRETWLWVRTCWVCSAKARSKSTSCLANPSPLTRPADRKQTARHVEAQVRSAVAMPRCAEIQ